jgi:hypothetical protein
MNILPNLLKLFDYPQKERVPLSWHGLCTAISTTLMMMGVGLTSNGVAGPFAHGGSRKILEEHGNVVHKRAGHPREMVSDFLAL